MWEAKSWVSAMRWAGLSAFLWRLADECGVTYTERHRETGLFTITIFYKVEAEDKAALDLWKKCLRKVQKDV